jgi:integrase
MSIVKRGKYWHIDVVLPSGERHRESTKTQDKKLAQELHDRVKARLWEEKRLGVKPEYRWEEAVERYLDEIKVDGLSDDTIRNYRTQLDWWGKEYFAGKNLSEIRKGTIMEGVYRIAKQRKQSTANRYLAPIRAMLYRAAHKWEWLDKAPNKFEQFDESQFERARALAPDEISRLSAELPVHQREMFLFSVATGLRQANVRGLRWTWVDLATRLLRVPANEFKNRRELAIPLTDFAISVLRRQIGKHNAFVFTYNGAPVSEVNTRAWRKALQRAGITDYRNHDNRHTWAHSLRKAGVDLADIQDLGGWRDGKMVRRYATPDMETLAQKAAKIETVLTQTRHSPELRVVGGDATA